MTNVLSREDPSDLDGSTYAVLMKHGQEAMARRDYNTAIDLFALAEVLSPDQDGMPRRLLNRAMRQVVPRWHFSMMNDTERNEAYAAAIAALVREGDLVLDIGTGAGLLALMSARAGAQVVTCEAEPIIASVARQIVAENHYEDRINVVTKMSTELQVGSDLPRKADVLITEVFDCALLGENILPTMADARRRLLNENGILIPRAARLWGLFVESEELYGHNQVGTVEGFELRAFEQLRSLEYFDTYLHHYKHRRLSEPFPIADFDFHTDPETDRYEVKVPIVGDGVVHAVVMWFELDLAPGITLANGPEQESTHWRQGVQTLLEPVSCTTGSTLTVVGTHASERMLLTVAGDMGE